MSHGPTARSDYTILEQAAPEVLNALRALGQAVDQSGLEKELTELLKVRASQINGCAFCLQYHLNLARKLDIAAAKLDLVAVWEETSLYSPRERAALAWTEALTRMNQQAVGDEVYRDLQVQFSQSEILFLTSAIGAINAWNRIAGGLLFTPPIPKG
ncbi:carboxymuconolactone decarboxylase family protein [Uliginosibacterium gangwonense]|uniref:carboxymuconolactone decarboxylase family protein n=1 Tax=Uliginosibacterium gangwonense TaxID=392736 RepID=UPI0003664559|nr:carboxymuconolactone decarboxylase family protein [Uliginosibacterium gangwonense]